VLRRPRPPDPAGHPYGGGGVRLLRRDLLKLAQMMLDGGVWNGHRIVSRDFAARAGSSLHDLRGIQYGYLWWNIEYPYKQRTLRALFAAGNGGQLAMAIPELDLVIAICAGNYSDRTGVVVQQELVPRYVLPAVREPGDDPGAPVAPREFTTLYGSPRRARACDHLREPGPPAAVPGEPGRGQNVNRAAYGNAPAVMMK
jgi:CubicO group peptidase (beta-lactamase class C family)